jgi:hypothetical protein
LRTSSLRGSRALGRAPRRELDQADLAGAPRGRARAGHARGDEEVVLASRRAQARGHARHASADEGREATAPVGKDRAEDDGCGPDDRRGPDDRAPADSAEDNCRRADSERAAGDDLPEDDSAADYATPGAEACALTAPASAKSSSADALIEGLASR